MADKPAKVLWINSVRREITERTIVNHLPDLHDLVAGYLECPYRFDIGGRMHNLLVWEEAKIQAIPPTHWFMFEGFTEPLAGNGVIIANNEEGDTINVTISIKAVEKLVKFISPWW